MSGMYLTEHDVAQLVDMRIALDEVQEGFRRRALGEVENVPRHRAQMPGIVLHSMSASAEYLGVVGWKNYTTTRRGARFLVGLHDAAEGKLVALIEADYLGRLRTGATTGVATSWMALPEVSELGLFGTGQQAETQLEAVARVRSIKQAFVYSRDPRRRYDFSQRMSARLGIEVIPVDRPQEAAEELPLVITATNSREPVLDGNWLEEGALICAVGSNWLNKAEIDTTVIRRADHIVCDDIEACRHEAGDFVPAIEAGVFDWSRAVNLADVVVGRAVGRARSENLNLFKSVGLALEDVALGCKVWQLAKERGMGRSLPG